MRETPHRRVVARVPVDEVGELRVDVDGLVPVTLRYFSFSHFESWKLLSWRSRSRLPLPRGRSSSCTASAPLGTARAALRPCENSVIRILCEMNRLEKILHLLLTFFHSETYYSSGIGREESERIGHDLQTHASRTFGSEW